MKQFSKRKLVILIIFVLVASAILLLPNISVGYQTPADSIQSQTQTVQDLTNMNQTNNSSGNDLFRGELLRVIVSPIFWFICGLGKALTLIIRLLVVVAQYNDFMSSPAVSKGWIIIRDICNMGFIIVLLLIAFSTVLGIEKFSYKRLLPSLLLAAILINFSKLICGVLIDVSQVVMLTFVDAFKAAAETNFAHMLGLSKMIGLDKDAPIAGTTEVLFSTLLALIMVIIALMVVCVMTAILLFRIVILWFLVIFSPAVFVAQILPFSQKWSSMWWQKFTTELVIGPVLAFMLWLSLAVVQKNPNIHKTLNLNEEAEGSITNALPEDELNVGPGAVGSPEYVLNFIIGIAMLIGSLMVTQQLGVAGAGLASFATGKLNAFARGTAKMPLKGAKGVARRVAVSKPAQNVKAWAGTQRMKLAKKWGMGWAFKNEKEKKLAEQYARANTLDKQVQMAENMGVDTPEVREKRNQAVALKSQLYSHVTAQEALSEMESGKDFYGQKLDAAGYRALSEKVLQSPDVKLSEKAEDNFKKTYFRPDAVRRNEGLAAEEESWNKQRENAAASKGDIEKMGSRENRDGKYITSDDELREQLSSLSPEQIRNHLDFLTKLKNPNHRNAIKFIESFFEHINKLDQILKSPAERKAVSDMAFAIVKDSEKWGISDEERDKANDIYQRTAPDAKINPITNKVEEKGSSVYEAIAKEAEMNEGTKDVNMPPEIVKKIVEDRDVKKIIGEIKYLGNKGGKGPVKVKKSLQDLLNLIKQKAEENGWKGNISTESAGDISKSLEEFIKTSEKIEGGVGWKEFKKNIREYFEKIYPNKKGEGKGKGRKRK